MVCLPFVVFLLFIVWFNDMIALLRCLNSEVLLSITSSTCFSRFLILANMFCRRTAVAFFISRTSTENGKSFHVQLIMFYLSCDINLHDMYHVNYTIKPWLPPPPSAPCSHPLLNGQYLVTIIMAKHLHYETPGHSMRVSGLTIPG